MIEAVLRSTEKYRSSILHGRLSLKTLMNNQINKASRCISSVCLSGVSARVPPPAEGVPRVEGKERAEDHHGRPGARAAVYHGRR